jgi:hypothetical protein
VTLFIDLAQKLPGKVRTGLYVGWVAAILLLGVLEWFGLLSIGTVTIDKLQEGLNYSGAPIGLIAAGNSPAATAAAARRHDDVAPLED